MTQLARITIGASEYEPRLWQILEDSAIDRDDFQDLDYFSLLPFFVLAGASIETNVEPHGDHFHFQDVRVVVGDDLVEPFYAALPQLLAQLAGEPLDDDGHGHSH